jgi:hypothetical protein
MACVCACVGIVLLVISLATSHWLEADGFYQGLWDFCWYGQVVELCKSTTDKGMRRIFFVLLFTAQRIVNYSCQALLIGTVSKHSHSFIIYSSLITHNKGEVKGEDTCIAPILEPSPTQRRLATWPMYHVCNGITQSYLSPTCTICTRH